MLNILAASLLVATPCWVFYSLGKMTAEIRVKRAILDVLEWEHNRPASPEGNERCKAIHALCEVLVKRTGSP